jgi:hypothetical protein
MATLRRVETPLDGSGLKLYVWETLAANEVGQAVICGAFPDKAVQLVGTFGGNMLIEGSLDPDGTVWATLNDPQGNPLSAISTAKIEQVLEHCYAIRPSAGAGVTDVDVWLLLATGGR